VTRTKTTESRISRDKEAQWRQKVRESGEARLKTGICREPEKRNCGHCQGLRILTSWDLAL
jgi:hypothetical protein